MRNNFKSNQDLTRGSIFHGLTGLAIPIVVGNILMNIFNIVDMIFVGRLGPVPIAAVAISGLVISFIWVFLIGIAMATAAMVSRSIGEDNYPQANMAAAQAILLGILLSGVLTLYGYFGADITFGLLGAEPEVLESGRTYFQIIFMSSLFLTLHIICAAVFRGAGDAVTPMISVAVSAGLNILFDPLLIFGLIGFPRLEVTGAGIATMIGRFTGMCILLILLCSGRSRVKLSWALFKPDFSMMSRLLKIGIPVSVEGSIRTIGQLFLMRIAALEGTMVVAAFGIGIRLNLFSLMPGFALGSANATMVGQNLGAQKPDRSEKSTWLAAKIYVGFMVIAGTSFFIAAPYVIKIFNSNPDVVSIGTHFLRIVSFGYPFLALGLILTMAFGGAGDTVSPALVLAVAVFGVQIPFALFLPKIGGLGTDGIWIAIAVSMIVRGILIHILFRKGKWKTKRI